MPLKKRQDDDGGNNLGKGGNKDHDGEGEGDGGKDGHPPDRLQQQLQNLFLKIAKCIFHNCKMYFSQLQNVFFKVINVFGKILL